MINFQKYTIEKLNQIKNENNFIVWFLRKNFIINSFYNNNPSNFTNNK